LGREKEKKERKRLGLSFGGENSHLIVSKFKFKKNTNCIIYNYNTKHPKVLSNKTSL